MSTAGDRDLMARLEPGVAARLAKHLNHPWHQVGQAVYCGPCHVRLYTGTVPDDHPLHVPPRKTSDRMRARWGKP